jgi:hypothetical protein
MWLDRADVWPILPIRSLSNRNMIGKRSDGRALVQFATLRRLP